MDRGVITYTAAYLIGISLAIPLHLSPLYALLALLLLLPASYLSKKNTIIFNICSHLALTVCGIGICSISEERSNLPPDKFISTINGYTEIIHGKIAVHFREMIPEVEAHATLCAISIGEKGYMGKELKQSFSAAGAMHVLALSGLHIGIAFAMIYTLLLPITAIRGGKKIRDIIAIAFIAGYSIMAGCPPSVIRAATMIILYRIAAGKFRKISNWDAIATSMLITCTLNPLQILNIGFQLSYSAVAGIALMYPTCNNAFLQLVPKWKGWKGHVWEGVHWLWGSLALSVCCQIATIPASLYHFGYSAPYFLLANLAAVPLATWIMYILTMALPLQGIPLLGDAVTWVLKTLLELLNSAVTYIGE